MEIPIFMWVFNCTSNLMCEKHGYCEKLVQCDFIRLFVANSYCWQCVMSNTLLDKFQFLYEPILKTIEKITTEQGWYHKTIDSANGLMRNIRFYLNCSIECLCIHLGLQQTIKHHVTGKIHGYQWCIQQHRTS